MLWASDSYIVLSVRMSISIERKLNINQIHRHTHTHTHTHAPASYPKHVNTLIAKNNIPRWFLFILRSCVKFPNQGSTLFHQPAFFYISRLYCTQWHSAALSYASNMNICFVAIYCCCISWVDYILATYALNGKEKQSLLQAWTGPEGSRGLRLPDFMTIGIWRW